MDVSHGPLADAVGIRAAYVRGGLLPLIATTIGWARPFDERPSGGRS